jgi:hypothetical protein
MLSAVSSAKIYLEYFASSILWGFLNPFGLRQMLRQAGGQLMASMRYVVNGIERYDTPLSLRLPFDGWWKVYNGGVTKSSSHSWHIISQRYAYDFVVVDETGKSFQENPSEPDNYFAFGQPVLAAADGTVIEARDGIRDYNRAGTGWIDWRTRDIRGNYVVIQHHNQQYTVYAHLQAGSVCVQPGEAVKAGRVIGKCGHSGHSTEPHLHFQLQDRADFHTAIGLPACFSGFERKRKTNEQHGEYIKLGQIERGDMVCNVNNRREGIVETMALSKPGIGDLVYSIVISLLTVLGILFTMLRVIEFVVSRLSLL